MATSAKFHSIFFLIAVLFSLQTLARESQFFSKVTRESNENTNTNNNLQQTQVKVQAKEEEQPAFLPQTNHDAYGLYSRETEVFFPSTTTTSSNQPQYTPQGDEPSFYNTKNNNVEKFETKEEGSPATANYNHQKNYATKLQGLVGYSGGDGNNYILDQNKKSYYYNGQKQGMSDTRFLENGRYFTNDAPSNNYVYQRGFGRPEYYNNNGYYSGSSEEFNKYYYQNNHGMQGGDHRLEEEEEFDFDP